MELTSLDLPSVLQISALLCSQHQPGDDEVEQQEQTDTDNASIIHAYLLNNSVTQHHGT